MQKTLLMAAISLLMTSAAARADNLSMPETPQPQTGSFTESDNSRNIFCSCSLSLFLISTNEKWTQAFGILGVNRSYSFWSVNFVTGDC